MIRQKRIVENCGRTNNGLGVLYGTAERRLLNDLMEYYQKLERPVANESEAIMLKFGLTLQQIMDVVCMH